MATVPKVLKNFNLFIDGQSYAGKVDEVTLPTLALTIEDHRGGGMDSSIPLDMGMEPLDLGFSLSEHSPDVYRSFGLLDQSAVSAVFRAALADNETVIPYIVTVKGAYSEISGFTAALGSKVPMEASIRLNYYRLDYDGQTLIEIDVINMVRKINGVDQLEAQRNILSPS